MFGIKNHFCKKCFFAICLKSIFNYRNMILLSVFFFVIAFVLYVLVKFTYAIFSFHKFLSKCFCMFTFFLLKSLTSKCAC